MIMVEISHKIAIFVQVKNRNKANAKQIIYEEVFFSIHSMYDQCDGDGSNRW